MNKKDRPKMVALSLIVLVIGLLLGAYFGYNSSSEKGNTNTITNFEECAQAGYPIMESYPRRCLTFTEIIDNENNVACTLEVKQCPDGSYVGRVSPTCEFAPCPGE